MRSSRVRSRNSRIRPERAAAIASAVASFGSWTSASLPITKISSRSIRTSGASVNHPAGSLPANQPCTSSRNDMSSSDPRRAGPFFGIRLHPTIPRNTAPGAAIPPVVIFPGEMCNRKRSGRPDVGPGQDDRDRGNGRDGARESASARYTSAKAWLARVASQTRYPSATQARIAMSRPTAAAATPAATAASQAVVRSKAISRGGMKASGRAVP